MKFVYYDTSAIRSYPELIEDRSIVPGFNTAVSPLTLAELCSQITVNSAAECQKIFAALQSLSRMGALLPCPTEFLRSLITGSVLIDAYFDSLTIDILHFSTSARQVCEMAEFACIAKDALDSQKRAMAEKFQKAVEFHRSRPSEAEHLWRGVFARVLAKRTGSFEEQTFFEHSSGKLGAYFDHRLNFLERAIKSSDFNFLKQKNLNEFYDSEQLVYLANPDAHFITCDMGFQHLVPNHPRVHVLASGLHTTEISQKLAPTHEHGVVSDHP